MKLNNLAENVLAVFRDNPHADAEYILSLDVGSSVCEVEFIITQLQMFGYI